MKLSKATDQLQLLKEMTSWMKILPVMNLFDNKFNCGFAIGIDHAKQVSTLR